MLTILTLSLMIGPAERGHAALTGKAFIPGFWPRAAYENAWRAWGVAEKPKDYDAAFRDRYGLAEAPYANDNLPMGLRLAPYLPIERGIGIDCMTCHGSSLLGKSIVGLGNQRLDIQALFEELAAGVDVKAKLPFTFTQARGTNEAGAFSVYLLAGRNPDLSGRADRLDLGLHDDSCEDVPAWWLLKKKRTMYHVGATDAGSVRSIMQFMMHPLSTRRDFDKAEATFADIMSYIKSIKSPKYPFPVDDRLSERGRVIFEEHCSRCHGTYGRDPTYPNRIIAIDEIGTDRKRYDNINAKFNHYYNRSWFAEKENGKIAATAGYQAPPLDGVWATAPYFHNGSVPTLAGVLDSRQRPALFTRSYNTGEADYDTINIGWKYETKNAIPADLSTIERRKYYDTRQPGRGNRGHTFGDELSDADRKAIIEYLKTL